jgi:hypothetical protein
MKKIILINFFPLLITMAFAAIVHGQQRPSQRSFASVMTQVKQKQTEREKMLQQIKLATPSNNTSQNGNVQFQPNTVSSTQQAAVQRSQPIPKMNQQPVSNKQANQQQGKIKKE